MNNYIRFKNDVNRFDHIFSCFNNFCSLSMGLFFPQCLFGRIYELTGNGECFVGCCKIYALQFINSIFFSLIPLFKYFSIIDKSEIEYIYNCTINKECRNYNITEIINNNCTISNTSSICPCLREPLIKYCHYEKDLPNQLYDFYEYTFIVSLISIFVYLNINGCFYGYYRTKLSKKYNILHNSKCDFFIHFLPCCHQLALCQEYNTIARIEELVYPINTM